jgi:hypothetical protein
MSSETGRRVISERGTEDAEHDRHRLLKTSGKNHRENLCFVTDLGETDDH